MMMKRMKIMVTYMMVLMINNDDNCGLDVL